MQFTTLALDDLIDRNIPVGEVLHQFGGIAVIDPAVSVDIAGSVRRRNNIIEGPRVYARRITCKGNTDQVTTFIYMFTSYQFVPTTILYHTAT